MKTIFNVVSSYLSVMLTIIHQNITNNLDTKKPTKGMKDYPCTIELQSFILRNTTSLNYRKIKRCHFHILPSQKRYIKNRKYQFIIEIERKYQFDNVTYK